MDSQSAGVVASCRLYYKDGSSDKEYHASINGVEGGYTVTFAFGRRGTALKAGTKTTAPVTLAAAQVIYDKLVAEKTGKGYTPDGSGALFAMTENEYRQSGLVPQLLNPVDEEAAQRYLVDDAWCLQEKFDGKRIMTSVVGGVVQGSNRKGLSVSMPQEISNALALLPDCELDGELLGSAYVVFDLLKTGDSDIRSAGYSVRYAQLTQILSCGNTELLQIAETAWDTPTKRKFFDRIASMDGEGVVFKKVDSPSVAGRPASGGSQVKCKFYATGSFVVVGRNDQRSVSLGLHNEVGKLVAVGNVTIPPNKEIPQISEVVEVRYLYAYKGGSLYQPHFLGRRDDISAHECLFDQLKYKPEGYAAEAE
jgi:bifunctional non-homologous end joining protein LigD